jgi:hypothetical protein
MITGLDPAYAFRLRTDCRSWNDTAFPWEGVAVQDRLGTIWDKLEECVSVLSEPFQASEIVGWFRRHYPEVNETSLRTHIQGATSNVSAASRGTFVSRRPLITRIERGVYVRARDADASQTTDRGPRIEQGGAKTSPVPPDADHLRDTTYGTSTRPDLLLVTCVKTKQTAPAAAKDMYTSPLFKRQRAYAESAGVPWFILSAEHGLLAPDEWLAPYERYLPDTPATYREAWGRWVVERLSLLVGPLHGKVVEIHASEEYVAAVRDHLQSSNATLLLPLRGLSHGRRLAWYDQHAKSLPTSAAPGATLDDLVERYVALLSDRSAAVSPSALDLRTLRGPGLYSWWVDAEGAAKLAAGLGLPLSEGLVYAGSAGATRWPSGKRSANTLAERILRMHVGGNRNMSTLRLTLGAILDEADRDPVDEAALTDWMNQHLTVVAHTVIDPDGLGELETQVLARLDPPLNLRDMEPSPLRRRLSELRGKHGREIEEPAPVAAVELERQFARAMRDIYERARAEAGYMANYFLRMLSELGPLETARRLLHSQRPSEGFTALWQRGRLDLTVESLVLRPDFVDLFTDEDRDLARSRLSEYGYEPH